MEISEISCVHCPKSLIASDGQGYESLRERIRCLCNNVIGCLLEATSQKLSDRREQMLRLKTSQRAWIRAPAARKLTDLHHILWRFEENIARVLEVNVSLKFASMKQIVPKMKSDQSTLYSSSGKINKRF